MVLAIMMVFSAVVIPVFATEETEGEAQLEEIMNSSSNSMSFGSEDEYQQTDAAPAEETAAEETAPEESIPEETAPEQTIPEETLPEEKTGE